MDNKEQNLRKINQTYYYYKTWFDLNKQEEKIIKYNPHVSLGSSEVGGEIDFISNNILNCQENYNKAKNKEGIEPLPNKADYKLKLDKKEAQDYKQEYEPKGCLDFIFFVLSFGVFCLCGPLLGPLIMSTVGNSKKSFPYAATAWVVISVMIALLFHHWLTNLYITKKEKPILNSRYEAYERDLKNVKDHNRIVESENDTNVRVLPARIEKYKKEIEPLEKYQKTLEQAENTVRNQLIAKNKKILKQFIDNKNNFLKNTYHFTVPQQHQFNWGYYGGLYEIIETGQAKEIPDAIRILEDRYQRAELFAGLKQQLQKSERRLSEVIKETSQNIINDLTQTINKQTYAITGQIQNNTNQLSMVQDTISNSTNNVLSSLNYLNSSVDGLHADAATVNMNLDNFQNEVNKGVKSINQTINQNFKEAERYY
ncbi:hypothetical protein QFX17_09940 [Lactobacillus helveticus]|uniref:hypothetical protein n=1 Tax=Lactobacillus helveticus TaxID=1587 RepID=UPI001562F82A|nr:hypothetical protein [Lactobacillus helveticus]MCO0808279.1 hypothetical protein [Lactobacillus helveticus]MCP9318025.1 hypothetical protein [Lactobacillus helveticus]MDH5818454.1 hypothetical protein [Lactobacillus helveticus]NRO77033.1 hypothetical protein [Lactobacillus helveticus]